MITTERKCCVRGDAVSAEEKETLKKAIPILVELANSLCTDEEFAHPDYPVSGEEIEALVEILSDLTEGKDIEIQVSDRY